MIDMRQTVLILGGKPIGSVELVEYAHGRGDKAVVADYLPVSESPAKAVADDCWDVSTSDIDELTLRARNSGVTAVMAGVHEFNIERQIDLTEKLGLPQPFSRDQWIQFEDKVSFKRLCARYGIEVAKEYPVDADFASPCYPLAVKPLDGSGSRGFSKVEKQSELAAAIEYAKRFSQSGEAIVEDFIEGDSVIIHYTLMNGKAYFCGITDKHSERAGSDGSPIMALQLAPSIHQPEYLSGVDESARAMLESTGVKNSPVWIEAFYREGHFIFNEAGLRLGGSMTNHLVKRLCAIDQMEVLYNAATGLAPYRKPPVHDERPRYAIFPVHVRSGVIGSINGIEEVERDRGHVATVWVHRPGDRIEAWGSAQQVLAYLHFCAPSVDALLDSMRLARASLSVRDAETGQEMLFSLFDPSDENSFPRFVHVQLKEGE